MITEFLGHIWKQHSIVKEGMIFAAVLWTWHKHETCSLYVNMEIGWEKNANFHNILIMHNAINVNDVM